MGYQFITGQELMRKFEEQVRQFPLPLLIGEELTKLSVGDNFFAVLTSSGKKFECKIETFLCTKTYVVIEVLIMAFTPPQNNAENFSFKDSCPYLEMDPSRQHKCETDDIMAEYLPGMYPASLSDSCFSPAENWIDCIYFKRTKLL